jgi:hypothetical protein
MKRGNFSPGSLLLTLFLVEPASNESNDQDPKRSASDRKPLFPLKLSLKFSDSSLAHPPKKYPLSASPTGTGTTSSSGIPKIKLSLKSQPPLSASAVEQPQQPEDQPLTIPKVKIKTSLLRSLSSSTAESPLTATFSKKTKQINFYSLLFKILEVCKSKDVYGFFWEPVDISLVPDYLDIIQTPMDFSTVESKITQKTYKTIAEFEHDILQISLNAKAYNAPETVFFKSADKLEVFARRTIAKEALRISEGEYQLLYEGEPPSTGSKALSKNASNSKSSLSIGQPERSLHSLRQRDSSKVISYAEDDMRDDFEEEFVSIDDSSPNNATNLARSSSIKKTNVALFKRNPDGSIVFSSLAAYEPSFFADGSLALDEAAGEIRQLYLTEFASGKAPIPTLGEAMGSFTSSISLYKSPGEPIAELSMATPLNYGPYVNSFGPSYDSAKAPAISPSESMLLSLTWSDAQCKEFVSSMMTFAQDSGSAFLQAHCKGLANVLCKGTCSVFGISPQEHMADPAIAASRLQQALVQEAEEIFPDLGDARETALYAASKRLMQLVRVKNARFLAEQAEPSAEEISLQAKVEEAIGEICASVQPRSLISEEAVYDLYQVMMMQGPEVPSFAGTM